MQYDFLQSNEWMKFQEAVGRRTFHISTSPPALPAGRQPYSYKEEEVVGFWANIVEHKLPIVGGYFYVPRGPILQNQNAKIKNKNDSPRRTKCKIFLDNLINLAKKENAGWIRFDAGSQEIFDAITNAVGAGLVPAPHDMQPKEIFVIDISKSEDDLLAEMKAKTRYNIKVAKKHNISVKVISNSEFLISNQYQNPNDKNFKFYVDEFVRLTRVMAKRNKITAHPDEYYRKMLEIISPEILKLYVAEYHGKIIAANLMVFYGNTCTYLHGASAAADEYRNVMAPYLLQWQAIKDAKKAGCKFYDFGGVSTNYEFVRMYECTNNKWAGITKFKIGFSPKTAPVEFLGSYDIVINKKKYYLYRIIQKIKSFL